MAAVVVLGLLAAAAMFSYARINSPSAVAQRYVVATAEPGDRDALSGVVDSPGGTSATEILGHVHGQVRTAPVVISRVTVADGETPSMKYVVVDGTSDGTPFTTGVTLLSQQSGLVWRVSAEWAP
ncbi:hypothetical protein BJY21_000301 [Kineosphaera limosa]|uniref:hypothetical protein n=1 Tax=Kineosphaera limosa TaxID=111564 RepID=UPI0002E9A698|nr:hypothetical protein [Kineosphaera limosa]NYD99116.1 hypothetical protein [Kineosphaera limosa]